MSGRVRRWRRRESRASKGVEIVALVLAGGKYHAPTWLVACPCGKRYQRTGWRRAVERATSCGACAMRRQRPRPEAIRWRR